MNILITGIDGYIGSVLAPYLMERGHAITGLDTGFYRNGYLYHETVAKYPRCINKDLREVTETDLEGFETVIHLAELSNDPLGQHNPALTYQINHLGTVNLATKCIRAGISRFIYTSSCSVYGAGNGDGYKTEESQPNPQTAYSRCKILVERDLSAMAADNFSPTFLRNATAYGPSPRMRFDLVLNNLAGLAYTTKRIAMTSDGTPWRPLVHVLDICEAIGCALEAPREMVHNEVFNVGNTKENYQVWKIAQIVSRTFPACEVTLGNNDGDNRSYRVSFDKISARLPRFQCRRTAEMGVNQLFELFERIRLTPEIFEFRAYTRLKQLQHLIHTHQIDGEFFWRPF